MNHGEHLNLYRRIAEDLAGAIGSGAYAPGDRVPSVRRLSRQMGVSISTVTQAYGLLVDRGMVEARPQSGYYVCTRLRAAAPEPSMSRPMVKPTPVSTSELTLELLAGSPDADFIQLATAVPAPDLLPTAALNRCLAAVLREHPELSAHYDAPFGRAELRTQVARLLHAGGARLRPEELVVTSGCQEALTLCLRAVAQAGDTIAVESPTYYGMLQAIESLGMHALEIPTHPREGLCLDHLEQALAQWPIKACLLVPTHSNPLGSCMSDANKRRLVELLASREIPLIEDDVYGDLGFTAPRPTPCKAYDRDGLVLTCSSFSKTLGPGFRTGWAAPGRYLERVKLLKQLSSFASAPWPQLAIARFLARGGYERHLNGARRSYARRIEQLSRAIARHFPEDTRATQPTGGTVVWIELPGKADTVELYRRARAHGIGIAPGVLFTAQRRYRNALRLNGAAEWDDRLEDALATLGRLAKGIV